MMQAVSEWDALLVAASLAGDDTQGHQVLDYCVILAWRAHGAERHVSA